MPVTTPVHENRSLPAKQLLKADGFTMADVAHASGTSLTTVYNCLSGLKFNDKVAEAVQRLYPRLSRSYLFGDES